MTDIFISCEPDDQANARRLVDSLRAVGYKVAFDEADQQSRVSDIKSIADRIAASKVILTLWTGWSVRSERVIEESERALKTGKYVGTVLDTNIRLPAQFAGLRTADMTGNSRESEEFDWLCETIDTIIGSPEHVIEPERTAKASVTTNAEGAIWAKVTESDNPPGYEFYLNQYGRAGAFAAEARQRLRELTTWWYRLGRFTNAGWVKAIAAVTIFCGAAALFTMSQSKANMVSQDQYAELQVEGNQLRSQLAAANDSRLRLIASFRDKVDRDEYVALSDRARELEEKLNRSTQARVNEPDGQYDLALLGKPEDASAFEELDRSLDDLLGGRNALENAVDSRAPGGIEPASGSPWTCSVEGGDGINFGSTCWPRTANRIALEGFGIETATDLAPVELLRELEMLEVAGARISELRPLSSMTALRELNISGTGVTDIAPLALLTDLEALDLRGTAVTDLSPLKNLEKLKSFCPPQGPCTVNDIASVQSYLDENAR